MHARREPACFDQVGVRYVAPAEGRQRLRELVVRFEVVGGERDGALERRHGARDISAFTRSRPTPTANVDA